MVNLNDNNVNTGVDDDKSYNYIFKKGAFTKGKRRK